MSLRLKNFLVFVAVISSGLFWLYAQGAEVNQTITVDMTVPAPSGGSGGGDTGGGEGGADVPPIIFNVVSAASFTTATVSWSATDDLEVVASTFVYGQTTAYGNSGTVTGNYRTDLFGLTTNTLYYFKISAIDSGSHVAEYAGTFTTLPPPPDVTPPIISNAQVVTGVTTATISWSTNELADSQINYGVTASYGSNYFDALPVLSHSVLLSNLKPNTLYHFQIISTDGSGNSANTSDATFTTKPDNVPPPDVSNFVLTTTTNSIVLSWTNPSLSAVPDFAGVRVVRKVGSPSVNPSDGATVYTGTGQTFTDTNVLININYFYTIFSFDTSNNRSAGIFRNGMILPTEPPPPEEIPPPPTTTPPGPEICNNGIDDDLNGQTDCADSACFGYVGCLSAVAACDNGLDDDEDGLVDFPDDPGCDDFDDNDEYNPPEPTVPEFVQIDLSSLEFLAANRRIKLKVIDGQVTGLSGASLTVVVPKSVLASEPKSMLLRVGGIDQHQFVYSAAENVYYADISFGQVGITQAYVEIDYDSEQLDSVGFKLNNLPLGRVVDADGEPLAGVEISLLRMDGTLAPMGDYGQLNPIVTDINGSFGWMAPELNYKIELYKNGYYDRSLPLSNIENYVINPKLELVARPPKLILEIDPEASISENALNIVKALGAQTKALSNIAAQKIQDTIADPEVQKVNQRVVAPTAIAVVAAGAIPFISWLDLLPFLRLLFLQPLMLLGWRKRERWGLVYNSLNKLPVDLATVRLINLETDKIVQSKVTDGKGRFAFRVNPGKYRLQVQKNNFVFPSGFLAGYNTDGQKVDIYHGEVIEVTSPTSITPTVPLDPVGAQKKPGRLVWEKIGRKLQVAISWSGILVTAGSLYISPKWYIGALLAAHISIFLIFHRLAMPFKPKNWGFVSDETSRAPVGRAIARLFNAQFNKLVDTQITDADGKYYFMAGDAKYYVTYEHKDYHPQKTDVIDLTGKDAEVLTLDAKLKKH